MSRSLNKVMLIGNVGNDPEVRAKFAANGAFVRHITPAEVTAFVQNEQKTWRPILQKVAADAKKK